MNAYSWMFKIALSTKVMLYAYEKSIISLVKLLSSHVTNAIIDLE